MFDSKCPKCGQKLVRLIHLKPYAEYLVCPNIMQILLSDFELDGNRIYCGVKSPDKKQLSVTKPENCPLCNHKLENFADSLRNQTKQYEICPSAFGLLLFGLKNEQKGLTTKIFCETKIEVDAKLAKPYEASLKKGVTNHPLALAKISNQASLSGLKMFVEVPIGWSFNVNPSIIEFQPPNSECSFSICISIPETAKLGEYFMRYGARADKIGDRKLGPNDVIKGFDKPTIVKITVT